MKTISSHVEHYIQQRPLLIKYMKRGIINYRALAKFIEPDISELKGELVSTGAIAVSLQRLAASDSLKAIETVGTLRGVSIISKLHLLTSSDSKTVSRLLEQVEPLAFTKAKSETSLLLDSAQLTSIDQTFLGEFTRSSELAAIGIEHVNKPDQKLVGGIVYAQNVLLEHNIAVVAVFSSLHEDLIVINETHIDRAAQLIRSAVRL